MTTHALLKAMKDNKPAFGIWINLPGVFNARAVARASPHLSWVLIDCEHGLTSLLPDAAESIQAIVGLGPHAPSPLVRIAAAGSDKSISWQIKYALDAGARGVLVPKVSTAEQARAIVADSRFPPEGRRGFGSPFTHGVWGITSTEYIKSSNDNIVIMIQIETKEGVQNVDALAAVDGIDCLLIGPWDLSLSLGYPPPSPDPHPDVEIAIQNILKATHKEGKKCAIYCTSGKQSLKRAEEGFDIISVTTDIGALVESVAANIATAVGGES
ncbi:Pyruvate/Phosphoenolpyruvate kinase-like domain-containing protein [Suillus clintonianus]|uniref:Pyruvate/Phosphoenolpyruvate kinase-like domain-containing protein n=1 Tax=Suillus clintonianus TaxID=1904413 RepID=UPI001B86FDC3|nr:Pyruvate/Phosphoenolpyruvate kinase-like domain-containing protein [Suillus clintonianus]KAG2127119.1 Pyruvate/Phosphoenolpyruvate kinase-like domain-containing protein [Suillus clintonianus]